MGIFLLVVCDVYIWIRVFVFMWRFSGSLPLGGMSIFSMYLI